mmetsp:Transcript_75985/g.180757  ORF Transcript_75985/g.180757 Transcript_75985/m.180757 type:complete len:215 (+) Transcript_75985:527-1171(+)
MSEGHVQVVLEGLVLSKVVFATNQEECDSGVRPLALLDEIIPRYPTIDDDSWWYSTRLGLPEGRQDHLSTTRSENEALSLLNGTLLQQLLRKSFQIRRWATSWPAWRVFVIRSSRFPFDVDMKASVSLQICVHCLVDASATARRNDRYLERIVRLQVQYIVCESEAMSSDSTLLQWRAGWRLRQSRQSVHLPWRGRPNSSWLGGGSRPIDDAGR